jgi:hypothetical protein
MCTVSSDIKALNITIHNLYPSLKLTSPVYFSTDTCHTSLIQQTNADNTLKASFGIDSDQKKPKGALLYKLQRKHANKTGNYYNNSTSSIKDITTNIHLLVIWNVKNYNHRFCVSLIECAGEFAWNEDKLWELYRKHSNQVYENYKSDIVTWLLSDGAVLKTKLDVTYGSDCKLDIVISKGTGKDEMSEPIQIDPKRLVLSLSMSILLMYTFSLPSIKSFKLNIHNQCSNADLVYPIYVTGDKLECHRPPGYKVCVGDTIGSTFIINGRHTQSYGALIYRLQRKLAKKHRVPFIF